MMKKVLITLALATSVVSAQTPTPNPPSRPVPPAQPGTTRQTPPARPAQTGQVFRAGTDIIPIDVYPRDAKGQFVPDLSKVDFQIFEDGVEQTLLNFTRANGGAFFNDLASTAPERKSEGLILPRTAPPADTAGRLFIIFIDDMHFMPQQTPEVRRMLQLIRDTLVHDTDLVGFVSSGFSSIEMDPAYDYQHRRFNEVINKVMGSGPSIEEMIRMQAGADGLAELNHNISIAFHAAKSLLTQMEDLHGKRKAFIWVSNGYSLDPFKDSRLKREFEKYANSGMCQAKSDDSANSGEEPDRRDPCTYANAEMTDIQNIRTTGNDYGFDIFNRPTMQWKTGDLMFELGELIRVANRANTMFFTMDPRGLIAGLNGASMQSALSAPEERDFIMGTTGTLRALAENTGGLACVGTNDCRPFLQQIDNMTSDYYMLGYRSSNPDPFKLARKIEIKVKRPGVRLEAGRDYRDMYYMKRQPKDNNKK
jgi:VWFA-related protein